MDILERLKILLKIADESQDNLLCLLLDSAKSVILAKAYPYSQKVVAVPVKYEYIQLDIAVYLYNKQGAEGQTSHNENGISRSYESAGIPCSMLTAIVPFIGTLEQ